MNYETTVNASSDGEAAEGERLAGAENKNRRRMLIAVAVIVLLMLAAIAHFVRNNKEPDFAAREGQAPTVTVAVPGTTLVQRQIQATGTLAARRAMPVGVVGDGGRIVSVPVEAGQWVRAGQVLAVIDRSVQTQQAVGAAAQIQVAKADAELAQANLSRALKLVDRGFISKADVDRLTATRDSSMANVKVVEAQYRELLARNARLNIVAPAAGLILERNVEPGQVVSPGSGALFNIAKDGEMELLAQLGETDLAALSIGAPAQVVPVGTQKTFVGYIWQLAPIISQQNRQGTARIELAYAPDLRPGGFASATIDGGTINAPMLPESAILSDDKGSYVYVVGADNKVHHRNVETGLVTDTGIAVTKGLSGKERVVLRAGGFLTDGEAIRPVKGSVQSAANRPGG